MMISWRRNVLRSDYQSARNRLFEGRASRIRSYGAAQSPPPPGGRGPRVGLAGGVPRAGLRDGVEDGEEPLAVVLALELLGVELRLAVDQEPIEVVPRHGGAM